MFFFFFFLTQRCIPCTMLEITDFCPKLRILSILITDFSFQRLASLQRELIRAYCMYTHNTIIAMARLCTFSKSLASHDCQIKGKLPVFSLCVNFQTQGHSNNLVIYECSTHSGGGTMWASGPPTFLTVWACWPGPPTFGITFFCFCFAYHH